MYDRGVDHKQESFGNKDFAPQYKLLIGKFQKTDRSVRYIEGQKNQRVYVDIIRNKSATKWH